MRLRTNGAAFGHSASMHAPPWHTKIMLGNSMLLRFTMRSSHLMHICSTSAHHCSANASSGPIEDDLARTCSMSGLIMARPMPLKELCVAHCSLPESFDASPPSSACHAQSSATCTSVVSHACSAAPAYLMLPESAPATSPPCPGRAKRWHHASIARCQPPKLSAGCHGSVFLEILPTLQGRLARASRRCPSRLPRWPRGPRQCSHLRSVTGLTSGVVGLAPLADSLHEGEENYCKQCLCHCEFGTNSVPGMHASHCAERHAKMAACVDFVTTFEHDVRIVAVICNALHTQAKLDAEVLTTTCLDALVCAGKPNRCQL